MSYYLALFDPPVDLAGIQGVRAPADVDVPVNALQGMTELAVAYALPGARFVVDETGDTAHDLVGEPWEPPEWFARYESTRLAELVRRAEESGASIAIWDACWDEATSGPAVVLKDYSAFRRHLSECQSEWEIGGLLCIPEAHSRG